MRTDVNKIRLMWVARLGFNSTARNKLIRLVDLSTATHGPTTVADVIQMIETTPLWDNNGVIPWSIPVKTFQAKLIELGMTVDDWAYLAPTPTAVMERLLADAAKRSKEHLFNLDIRMLGRCVSADVLRELSLMLGKAQDSIKISDLVVAAEEQWRATYFRRHSWEEPPSYYFYQLKLGLIVVRQKLIGLGLGYEDGFFFQIGTRRLVEGRFAKDLRMTKNRASNILRYAQQNGWGPKVQFET